MEQKRESGYYWVQLKFDVGLPQWLIALYDGSKDKWYLPGVDGKTTLFDHSFASISLQPIVKPD